MRKFNKEEEKEISFACNTLRASMVIFSAKEAIKNNENNIGNIAKIAGKGSVINNLVQNGDWENLFKNEDWLNLLDSAENVNILVGNMFLELFSIISKYFPEETKAHLIPRTP